jgi:hypothetical protein
MFIAKHLFSVHDHDVKQIFCFVVPVLFGEYFSERCTSALSIGMGVAQDTLLVREIPAEHSFSFCVPPLQGDHPGQGITGGRPRLVPVDSPLLASRLGSVAKIFRDASRGTCGPASGIACNSAAEPTTASRCTPTHRTSDVIAARAPRVRARQLLAYAVEHLGVGLQVGVADLAAQLDNLLQLGDSPAKVSFGVVCKDVGSWSVCRPGSRGPSCSQPSGSFLYTSTAGADRRSLDRTVSRALPRSAGFVRISRGQRGGRKGLRSRCSSRSC